jgi:hypothetical protein
MAALLLEPGDTRLRGSLPMELSPYREDMPV